MSISRRYRFCVSALVALVAVAAAQEAGKPAPPLTLESLSPPNAQATWEALRGKPVVLEFWATWCGPCVEQIPHLNELAAKIPEVQFISITDEEPAVVEKFLAKRPITGWIGFDRDRSTFKAYGVEGIPHTVLVDAGGVVQGVTHASGLTETALADVAAGRAVKVAPRPKASPGLFKQALAEGPPPLLFVLVRPAADPYGNSVSSREGSLEAKGWPLRFAIADAYGMDAMRVEGPEALEARYDIALRLPHGFDDRRDALRQVLEQTFKLRVQRETRDTDAFELRVVADKLSESASTGGSSSSASRGKGKWTGVTLASFARTLESMLKRPVFDETGRTARYDFALEWDADNPDSIRDALRERLGLELVSARRAVEYLVVEAIEPPLAR